VPRDRSGVLWVSKDFKVGTGFIVAMRDNEPHFVFSENQDLTDSATLRQTIQELAQPN
jgi:hypothetical protein